MLSRLQFWRLQFYNFIISEIYESKYSILSLLDIRPRNYPHLDIADDAICSFRLEKMFVNNLLKVKLTNMPRFANYIFRWLQRPVTAWLLSWEGGEERRDMDKFGGGHRVDYLCALSLLCTVQAYSPWSNLTNGQENSFKKPKKDCRGVGPSVLTKPIRTIQHKW